MRESTWRDSARPVRFYMFDARLLALVTLWIFWPSLATTALVAVALAGFRIAEARGYRLEAALRALRAACAGRRRALAPGRSRRFADLG